MQATNPEVRALAEQCIALLQSASGSLLDEEAVREGLAHVVALLSSSKKSPAAGTSPRAVVRTREAPGRRPGPHQSKSVALPPLSSRFSGSTSPPIGGGGPLSPSASSTALTPPVSPPATKGRSGSVWSATPSPQVERKSAAATPTLGRHKTNDAAVAAAATLFVTTIPGTETPPLSRSEQSEREGLAKLENARLVLSKSKELEHRAKEGALCSSCRARSVFQPCTECWEGQCADVACAGLYTLKSLGEAAKRLICKRCIEKLKQRAVASRAETHDGKARPPAKSDSPNQQPPPRAAAAAAEADNPMFLAAQMRRRPAGPAAEAADEGEATNPMFNAGRRRGKEPEPEVAVDQDDPFDDFSWTGVSDEDEEDNGD